ncbi:Ger(x)C family spore germination protein [Sulfoacidibacillus ferrooxidans]|uniref:Spore germination protein A3 n=1 Tax=Sulfoacidibacillus ferrooxidans TaxID=2005001 RepID=A0A9X2AED3_9BACL|nr:Ger(x)C family spore germination protein [Sulfoacidibacillus ferrooxidans]MCI0184450.1 Spore germination protein A3 [Sulfoacidibacillus ferrooxidans]
MNISRFFSQMILYGLLSISVTGCWSSLELRDSAIVSGIGIEKVGAQQFRLIVEIIGAQMGKGGTSTKGRTILTGTGQTALTIEREMIRDAKRRIVFTHTKSLVMSSTVAREDLYWVFDTWIRDQQPHLAAYLFVTHDPVKQVLHDSTSCGANAAFPLSSGMENIRFISNYTTPTMREFLRDMYGPMNTGYLPMIHIQRDLSKTPLVEYAGTAIFHHNHMVGELNTRETQGLVWLLGQEKGGAVDVANSKSHSLQALELTKENTIMHMQMTHGHLVAHFQFHIEGTLAQDSGDHTMDPSIATKQMEVAIAKKVQAILTDTITVLQKKDHADILDIGLHLYRTQPQLWHQLSPTWDDVFTHAQITTSVKVHIVHPGLARYVYPKVPMPSLHMDWEGGSNT